MSDLHCMRYYVSGKVQGVCFRTFVLEEARRLGLKGFVRNLKDGRVEVQACGEEIHLHTLYGLLQQGPPRARVEIVNYEALPAAQAYENFSILY